MHEIFNNKHFFTFLLEICKHFNIFNLEPHQRHIQSIWESSFKTKYLFFKDNDTETIFW